MPWHRARYGESEAEPMRACLRKGAEAARKRDEKMQGECEMHPRARTEDAGSEQVEQHARTDG